MQTIRDDLTKAINRGEVTIMMLGNFSKAFDAIRFKYLISKMNKLGFCKDLIPHMDTKINFVSHRRPYAQIDDIRSNTRNTIYCMTPSPFWVLDLESNTLYDLVSIACFVTGI